MFQTRKNRVSIVDKKFIKDNNLDLWTDEQLDISLVRQMPVISLAYIGDGVYDLYIRNKFIAKYPRMNSNKLNQLKVQCVKASAQANAAIKLFDSLTEAEQAVLKRGRNAKSATVPKNAKLSDYRYATGFEALIGYLYLLNQKQRLLEIMDAAFAIYLEGDNEQR